MDYKKYRIGKEAITRNLNDFDKETGNIYKTVVILSKRADQINQEMKEELHQKIQEFQTTNDTLEEVFENREQIELAKYYEQLPKPTLMAIHEFEEGDLVYTMGNSDSSEEEYIEQHNDERRMEERRAPRHEQRTVVDAAEAEKPSNEA
ncbi:MAG: DNA-directed RNA polymerase subunit omega [Bacteroidales bacterium]|nr:DNA-directed RNA polymerase subunit omega [Bacteroidales bacterium]MBR6491253.1 DNA-directed RNA polymerase subunit omega [Bacteroidales bacterium]